MLEYFKDIVGCSQRLMEYETNQFFTFMSCSLCVQGVGRLGLIVRQAGEPFWETKEERKKNQQMANRTFPQLETRFAVGSRRGRRTGSEFTTCMRFLLTGAGRGVDSCHYRCAMRNVGFKTTQIQISPLLQTKILLVLSDSKKNEDTSTWM